MNPRLWQTAVERAGRLAAPLALDELPDADLLGRFAAARDEPAFAALVRRHGPLVWGVCRALSPTEADAEDAFQGTFLALLRSAAKVRQPNALGAWLHGVAGRVCRSGLRARGRRARRERAAAVAEAASPVPEAAWDRWQEAVHAEIDRLPDALRVPFVLCVLQGVRQGEAARRLGWKVGTVSGRVCQAKQRLADAITRRGLVGAAGLAGVAGAGMLAAPLPAALVAKGTVVVRSAAGPGSGVSITVHELARGATGGVMSKAKLLATAVLAGALTVGAVGTNYSGTAGAQGPGFGPPADDGPRTGDPNDRGAAPLGPGGPSGLPAGRVLTGLFGADGGSGTIGSSAGGRVEYCFQSRPDGVGRFKGLLTQLGNDGWEYIGPVPGQDELIFKRAARPAAGAADAGGGPGTGPMGGYPGMGPGMMPGPGAPGGGYPRAGGPPPGATPGGPGGGRGDGRDPAGSPGSSPRGGGRPPSSGGGPGPGRASGPADRDPADSGSLQAGKPAETVDVRVGETIRCRVGSEIDRMYVRDPRVAEAAADPANAGRILIKGLAAGVTQLELTGANGTTATITIRVP